MTRLQEMKLIAEGSERDRLELQKQLDAQRMRADTAEAERDALRTSKEAVEFNLNKVDRALLVAEQRIAELESDEPEWSAMQQRLGDENTQLRDRIAELESGRREPSAWEVYWTDEDEFYKITRSKEFVEKRLSDPDFRFVPLFTATPAWR